MGRIGIRVKLSITLIVAAAVPLATGLVSIRALGREYYQRDKGRLFATMSQYLAGSFSTDLNAQVDHLRDEARLSGLGALLRDQPTPTTSIDDLEARWIGLTDTSPEIQYLLTNAVAQNVKAFQRLNTRFAELLVTDAQGRLVGATNRSSDYDQSDEEWWQKAMGTESYIAWLEGIHYDQSAGVYSVDISVPIPPAAGGARPIGVLKGVLDVSPVFTTIDRILPGERPFREVVLGDGRILTRLFDEEVSPLEIHFDPILLDQVQSTDPGWLIMSDSVGQAELVGFTPILVDGHANLDRNWAGLTPMYVIVHDSLDSVMGPINRQLRYLTLAGLGLMLSFLLVGLRVADRRIVGPIQTLRSAAQLIAAQARLGGAEKRNGTPATPPLDPQQTERLFVTVQEIDTTDEIGDLAHDFLLMAKRVLRYHEQLESELAIKTEEIEQDLVVAREFQEALLPSTYPTVPRVTDPNSVSLDFFHVYKPASSVGGDFFHMVQISDHEAGVFIADVMGHGARSALITAILRTLLENLARETGDPAELLTRINAQFWSLLPRDIEFVFATAFYAVFDTRTSEVRFASAGHPPPLVIQHATPSVHAILDTGLTGPALGLFAASSYPLSRRELEPGDVVLLYTDGVIEAPNPDGEEFGQQRLRDVIETHSGADGEAMASAIMDALHRFMDIVVSPDDICLVTVDIRARKGGGATRADAGSPGGGLD